MGLQETTVMLKVCHLPVLQHQQKREKNTNYNLNNKVLYHQFLSGEKKRKEKHTFEITYVHQSMHFADLTICLFFSVNKVFLNPCHLDQQKICDPWS